MIRLYSSFSFRTPPAWLDRQPRYIVTRATAASFAENFLPKLDLWTLSNLRFLHYDASIWDKYLWQPSKLHVVNEDDWNGSEPLYLNIDFDSFADLAQALSKFKMSLPLLEEVQLSGSGDCSMLKYRVAPRPERDADAIWRFAMGRGWELAEEKFTRGPAKGRLGLLQGWSISREVTLCPCEDAQWITTFDVCESPFGNHFFGSHRRHLRRLLRDSHKLHQLQC